MRRTEALERCAHDGVFEFSQPLGIGGDCVLAGNGVSVLQSESDFLSLDGSNRATSFQKFRPLAALSHAVIVYSDCIDIT